MDFSLVFSAIYLLLELSPVAGRLIWHPKAKCPSLDSVKTIRPFYMQIYSGNWYVVSKSVGTYFDPRPPSDLRHDYRSHLPHPMRSSLICENSTGVSYDVTRNTNGNSYLNVTYEGYSQWARRKFQIKGILRQENAGTLTMHFKNLPNAPYWVIDTDYGAFSLVISCRNDPFRGRQDMIWILSRTKQMDAVRLESLKALLAEYGFDTTHLVDEPQYC